MIGAIRSTMHTGNITEAPELGTPRYQGRSCWSQWCPLYRGSTLYKLACDFPPVEKDIKVQLLKDYFTLIVYGIESFLSIGVTLQTLFMSVLGVLFSLNSFLTPIHAKSATHHSLASYMAKTMLKSCSG